MAAVRDGHAQSAGLLPGPRGSRGVNRTAKTEVKSEEGGLRRTRAADRSSIVEIWQNFANVSTFANFC